jgi:hypothetical protein
VLNTRWALWRRVYSHAGFSVLTFAPLRLCVRFFFVFFAFLALFRGYLLTDLGALRLLWRGTYLASGSERENSLT